MRTIEIGVRPVPYFVCKLVGRFFPPFYWSGVSNVKLRRVPEPELLGPDWVRVRPTLSGICASDLAGVLRISGASLAAGLSMGLGALGPAIGGGFAGAWACVGIARNPLALARIRTTMLMGAAVAQSTAIYAFTVSMILLLLK